MPHPLLALRGTSKMSLLRAHHIICTEKMYYLYVLKVWFNREPREK